MKTVPLVTRKSHTKPNIKTKCQFSTISDVVRLMFLILPKYYTLHKYHLNSEKELSEYAKLCTGTTATLSRYPQYRLPLRWASLQTHPINPSEYHLALIAYQPIDGPFGLIFLFAKWCKMSSRQPRQEGFQMYRKLSLRIQVLLLTSRPLLFTFLKDVPIHPLTFIIRWRLPLAPTGIRKMDHKDNTHTTRHGQLFSTRRINYSTFLHCTFQTKGNIRELMPEWGEFLWCTFRPDRERYCEPPGQSLN